MRNKRIRLFNAFIAFVLASALALTAPAQTTLTALAAENVTVVDNANIPMQPQADAASEYGYTVYDRSMSRTVGVTTNGVQVDFATIEGMELSVEGTYLYYRYYTHIVDLATGARTAPVGTVIRRASALDKPYLKVNTATEVKQGCNLSKLDNGLYVIQSETNIGTRSRGWFEIIDGKPILVRIAKYASPDELNVNINTFNEEIAGADPANYLDLTQLVYPSTITIRGVSQNVQVKQWAAISGQILALNEVNGVHLDSTGMSDMTKVYLFTEWIRNNIAYDFYSYNNNNKTRPALIHEATGTWDAYYDNMNFSLYNHVGVCWDITNILAIMCRSQGIPCTSVGDLDHTWNVIWTGTEWMQLDVTWLLKYKCYDLDTSSANWIPYENETYILERYGEPRHIVFRKSLDDDIWTQYYVNHPELNDEVIAANQDRIQQG